MKAGWIQPVFNNEYKEKYSKPEKQDIEIDESVMKFRNQIMKYIKSWVASIFFRTFVRASSSGSRSGLEYLVADCTS